MKQTSKRACFLPAGAASALVWSLFFLVPSSPRSFAYVPETDDPKLEEIRKNFSDATSEYRDALKEKRGFIENEIKNTEELLITQEDKETRKKLVEQLRDLNYQINELNDKLRVISAGEVVKFSNTKDKVIAFLTHQ